MAVSTSERAMTSTRAVAPAQRSSRPLRVWWELPAFFVLTYALTIAMAAVAPVWDHVPDAAWNVPRIFSPTIVALVLAGLIGGRSAVGRLLAGLLRWRVGLGWYVAATALLWMPLLLALGYALLGYPVTGMAPGMTAGQLALAALFTLYSGPMAEEVGWRGFALPRLQERLGALTSSLLLGVIWAGWHLPFYAVSGGGAGIPFPIYLVLVTVLTVYITWIYNNTGGSILLCVLAHFSFNASSAFIAGHLGLLPRMVFNVGAGAGLLLVVVAVVSYYGPSRLARWPLASAVV